ncbi:hypothetical protein E4U43_006002, partial [Claviceps pusilla]
YELGLERFSLIGKSGIARWTSLVVPEDLDHQDEALEALTVFKNAFDALSPDWRTPETPLENPWRRELKTSTDVNRGETMLGIHADQRV